jgi:hypothetical protein
MEYGEINCPLCGWEAPPFEGKYYTVNKKKYPVFLNEHKYYNGSFDMHDWDERHCCPKCKKEFEFSNGSV